MTAATTPPDTGVEVRSDTSRLDGAGPDGVGPFGGGSRPPGPGTDGWLALRQPAMVAVGGVLAAVALHLRDPNVAGSWGPSGIGLCPFHAITGLWCPGCGGLRAVHHLTHMEWGAALSNNVLTVVLVAALTVAWVRWVSLRWQGLPAQRMLVLSPTATTVVFTTMAVFTVLRNLPVGAFLAP